MNGLRQILNGVGIGVIAALLVHQLFEHGLDIQRWSLRDGAVGRMMVLGAVIGALSQVFGQASGRR